MADHPEIDMRDLMYNDVVKSLWKGNNKPENFEIVSTRYSHSKEYPECLEEWFDLGRFISSEMTIINTRQYASSGVVWGGEVKDSSRHFCICSQVIKHLYYIENYINHNILRIGSCCIEKYGFRDKVKERIKLIENHRTYTGENKLCRACHRHIVKPDSEYVRCNSCIKNNKPIRAEYSIELHNKRCDCGISYSDNNHTEQCCDNCWQIDENHKVCDKCQNYYISYNETETVCDDCFLSNHSLNDVCVKCNTRYHKRNVNEEYCDDCWKKDDPLNHICGCGIRFYKHHVHDVYCPNCNISINNLYNEKINYGDIKFNKVFNHSSKDSICSKCKSSYRKIDQKDTICSSCNWMNALCKKCNRQFHTDNNDDYCDNCSMKQCKCGNWINPKYRSCYPCSTNDRKQCKCGKWINSKYDLCYSCSTNNRKQCKCGKLIDPRYKSCYSCSKKNI